MEAQEKKIVTYKAEYDEISYPHNNSRGMSRESAYRCLKDFSSEKIRVWDSNMGDKYRYDVDMNDLVWEFGDSIKHIMGYECQLAHADYHGRRWDVWFTPEISI